MSFRVISLTPVGVLTQPSGESIKVGSCSECGGLVSMLEQDRHLHWHTQEDRRSVEAIQRASKRR